MPKKYTCVSRNSQGERVTAMVEAETRQGLLLQLKEQGLTAVEVKEFDGQPLEGSKGKKFFSLPSFSWRQVGTEELAVFWREFATMVSAGLPIVDALQSITEELENKKFQACLQDVVSHIWEGFSFSDSMKKHPRVFSLMTVALIGAAEESGSLPVVASQLATFLENRDRLIRKVWAALTYPIVLSIVFLGALIVSTFWIIPKFREIYADFHAQLPWLTEKVFAVNAFILAYLPWIIIASVLSILALILWARKPSGRQVIDRTLLKLPLFGRLVGQASVARLCRSLAILLGGGIPINRALEMAQATSGNSVLAKAIQLSREEILKGGKIAATLKQHTIFPRMAIRMISAGEETGDLNGLLEKVADFYESRVDAALTTINTLIEPFFIIVIGMFVLVLVLSLYMPLFSLGKSMRL